MKSAIYNSKGEKTGEISLPESIFGLKWNADLVHQVVVAMEANKRKGTAHTKDRSEVSGGGRKPWKQKGTGRARHGSTRSPIWAKGGVTFGPRNDRDYSQKINKQMRTKALFTVLSRKLKDGEIIFVDSIIEKMDKPKTKEAKNVLVSLSKTENSSKIATKRKNAAFVGILDWNENISKSFRNIGSVKVDSIKNINPVEVLRYKYLVIEKPEQTIEFLNNKIEKSAKTK